MKRKDLVNIDNDDFVIRIRPYQDDNGSWNGEIDIAIISQPENTLDDDDYYQMMHFCKMVASSVPIMENNKKIRDIVHDYVVNVVDNNIEVTLEEEDEEKDEVQIINNEGNVVTVNFKTKGNA